MQLEIGDKAKEYIFTKIGECIGCIEIDIAQNLDGEKIKIVSDSHGGVGFIMKGSTALLDGNEHVDDFCMVPDDKKYHGQRDICSDCWMRQAFMSIKQHD